MPKSTCILAIDQGTTSTRAVIFDETGQPLAVSQKPLRQIYPSNGWVEHDPEEIWMAVVDVCRTVIAKIGQASRIATIGITNQRETTLVWDRRTGKPVMNAIVWQDRRSSGRCNELKVAGLEKTVQDKTGLLLDSYFSATKVEWVLRTVEGARAAADAGLLAFGTIDTFLLWRLTGGRIHATDATNASRTMLYNIHTGRWDDDLLALFRIPKSMLPNVHDTAGPFGDTDETILGAEIPICSMVGDQQSALVGQTCFAPGMIKSTYGTGCFMLVNTGMRALKSRNRMLTTIAYQIDGKISYALEGSIFNAGTIVRWLRDNMKLIERAEDTEALAASLDGNDSNGQVFFVPAFTGLGAPHWDPNARGAILGLRSDSDAAEVVRAALESVCFQTNDLLTAFRQDGIPEPAALRVDGGMAGNAWFLQSLADICHVAVERPTYGETTVLGAALLAGLGYGIYNSLEEMKAPWHLGYSAVPKMADTRRTALLDGWQTAVARIKTEK